MQVTVIPSRITSRHQFKDWFIKRTERIFHKEHSVKELRPLGILLTKVAVTLAVSPDYSTDKLKSQSMREIKQIALASQAVAFGLVSEGWMKIGSTEDKETIRLLDDLDGQVSLLPGNQEALLCSIEVREDDKIKTTLVTWPILSIDGIRFLGPVDIFDNPDKTEGRMTHVLG